MSRGIKKVIAIGLVGFASVLFAHSDQTKQEPQVQRLAPGWGELGYHMPAAGSYSLPKIRPAPGGEVLLSDGSKAQLHDYFDDKISVLTFIYTRCSDVNGCPVATFVLHSMQKSLRDRDDIKDQVRFITTSFDPENDTPQVMKEYAEGFSHKDGHEWLFATTESREKLQPILDHYGQFTFEIKDKDGKSEFAHLLRAFLIDRDGYIRNIYSVDFLHPKILLADIETLMLERKVSDASKSAAQ